MGTLPNDGESNANKMAHEMAAVITERGLQGLTKVPRNYVPFFWGGGMGGGVMKATNFLTNQLEVH